MKRIMKKSTVLILIVLHIVSITAGIVFAEEKENRVVSLGANLSEQQRKQILNLFDVREDEVKIIEVTNQEERAYLEGKISEEVIGKRAFSSAYVELLDDDEGISVETHNINWVTKEMYANAMVTAGVENARVIAAAPFEVSGTAALTGIMKAFEEATGEELSEEAKQAANDELVTTGKLGDDIGKDKAASLIQEIIINIAAELNINITQEHIDQLAALMERISKLDLSVDKISKQLENINKGLEKVRETIEQNKGLFQQILDAIKRFFGWLADLLRG
jgi:uncharacterized protein YpuA (DUF1002 family)